METTTTNISQTQDNNTGYVSGNNSSRWRNILPAIGAGAIAATNGNKTTYVPTAQWMGKGLARTGLEELNNNNYINPYDFGQLWDSVLYKRGNGRIQDNNSSNSNFQFKNVIDNGRNVLGKLGGLFNRNSNQPVSLPVLNPQATNSIEDYARDIVENNNGGGLNNISLTDYIQNATNYGGWTPNLLSSSYDNLGGFDTNNYGYTIG